VRWSIAFLAAWLLAACAPRDNGDVVTLRFWAMGREGEVVRELVREFEREHPQIRVRVQQIPWTAAHEKLLTAYVGHATPDVAQLGNTWIAEFEAINALQPLDSFVAASAVVDPADYFPGIWATNLVEDRVYGVPWYVDTRLLFYRTDLLAAAGWTRPPQSWAEWRRAMHDLRELMEPGRYPIFLPLNEWVQPVVLGMQAGSPLLRDGGRRGAFSQPEFSRGFEFYTQLFEEGLAPAISAGQVANIYQEFASGTFAMWITGPWNVEEMRRRLPAEMEGRWATAPLPGPTGLEDGFSLAGGASLVLFRGSRHPREAWLLMEFLSRPEQQANFHRVSANLPPRPAVWREVALLDDPHMEAFFDQLQRVRPLPMVPEIELIVTRVFEQGEAAVRGGITPTQALRNLDRDVDRILEKRRWMLDQAAAP
jgi:multiple sugar transport system substrate-binding protein